MSTNSRIGIQGEDGSILSVYCHWDGHTHSTGKELYEHYQERGKVMSLVKLGDLSAIYGKIGPGEGESHSFDKPLSGVTVAYHRDRDEQYSRPLWSSSLERFKLHGFEEYGYVYTNENEWVYCSNDGREIGTVNIFHKLSELFKDKDIVP